MNNLDDTITIPKATYETLLQAKEDLEDIIAYDKAIERDEETVPSDFVERMLNGESLLALWREYRGLSQSKLSELSGVNRIQIIDIEKNGKTGSVATLKKLADALSINIDDLI